jgi:hypothetical protein
MFAIFFLFSLEIGDHGYQKMIYFTLMSKIQTCLSDKTLLKEDITKKCSKKGITSAWEIKVMIYGLNSYSS